MHPNWHFLDIQQVIRRWSYRIVLPKAFHQNIILSFHNINFPFSDHWEISQNFLENFTSPIPLTHTSYHTITLKPHNTEPTQNFKFIFLKSTFWLHFNVYFPHPSHIHTCNTRNTRNIRIRVIHMINTLWNCVYIYINLIIFI